MITILSLRNTPRVSPIPSQNTQDAKCCQEPNSPKKQNNHGGELTQEERHQALRHGRHIPDQRARDREDALHAAEDGVEDGGEDVEDGLYQRADGGGDACHDGRF